MSNSTPPSTPTVGARARASDGRSPDLPPVPVAASTSLLSKALVVCCLLVTGSYALAATAGWEPGVPEREEIPPSVRSAQGGYRSFHFWHSGYHGGK
jgi:hypothetical protein